MNLQINKSIWVAALALGTLWSCSKEDALEENLLTADTTIDNTLVAPQEIGVFTLKGNGRVPSVNMLQFPSFDVYAKKVEELEASAETYDDAFMRQHGGLSEDALEDIEDRLEYNPHQPYIDYESKFSGFKSLRSDIDKKEEAWLNNDELDVKTDPDNHFVFDDGERSLLNIDGQVKIGRYVHQRTKYGFIKILNNDLATLNIVNSQDVRDLDLENIEIDGGYFGAIDADPDTANRQSCVTWRDRTWYHHYASKRRIKAKQKLTGPSAHWRSKASAKTVHYKKKRGRWKRRRAHITAQVTGQVKNQHCAQPGTINKSRSRNRRQVKIVDRLPQGTSYGHYRTSYRQLKTNHRKNGTSTTSRFFYQ